MCKRFEEELGYKYVAPFSIYSEEKGGRVLYTMIHCSDHEKAIPLMQSAYREVLGRPHSTDEATSFEWSDESLLGNKSVIDEWLPIEALLPNIDGEE